MFRILIQIGFVSFASSQFLMDLENTIKHVMAGTCPNKDEQSALNVCLLEFNNVSNEYSDLDFMKNQTKSLEAFKTFEFLSLCLESINCTTANNLQYLVDGLAFAGDKMFSEAFECVVKADVDDDEVKKCFSFGGVATEESGETTEEEIEKLRYETVGCIDGTLPKIDECNIESRKAIAVATLVTFDIIENLNPQWEKDYYYFQPEFYSNVTIPQ